MADKLAAQDSRVQYKSADVNGRTYSYILAEPQNGAEPVATIFLIHGFPDMAFGWRYQIPALQALNFRVVVPNMQGYSSSSSPQELSAFTYKTAADDVAALAKVIGATSIILGGHDWGGAIVYRISIYYPQLITAVFSICTPFFPPQPKYTPMTVLPNFKYQLQLQGPDVEREIVGVEKLRLMLNATYGGQGPNKEIGFTVADGVLFDNLEKLGPSPLISKEDLDYYAEQYAIHGIRGPLNWYRTGELNFEDEKEMAELFHAENGYKIEIPTMFIAGTRDAALPPVMSEGMAKWFGEGKLRKEEVDSSHWALWEKSEEVNSHIKDFLLKIVGGQSHL
ncbi:epoxide hydrolase [Sclerotinia borealis F-4128]|uniref:Epoxide hydrolase n=1 Tax=Sclerotinia borealis (strain F-4128) TaxID=1432307 RepID=W9C033_SCLBF|nr:epoxide hydrolase [Sclerotinia borealis F-4128]